MRKNHGARFRRLPVGAEILPGGGVQFRVWAPRQQKVTVVLEPPPEGGGEDFSPVEMEPEPGGYYTCLAAGAGADTLYRFRFEGEERLFSDPLPDFSLKAPKALPWWWTLPGLP